MDFSQIRMTEKRILCYLISFICHISMKKSSRDFWKNIPNINVRNKPSSSFYSLRFKVYEACFQLLFCYCHREVVNDIFKPTHASLLTSLIVPSNCYKKSSVIWDITPRSPLKIKHRFGGTCCLHLQGQKLSQARNQQEAGIKQ
jgi:hypothetical protein